MLRKRKRLKVALKATDTTENDEYGEKEIKIKKQNNRNTDKHNKKREEVVERNKSDLLP